MRWEPKSMKSEHLKAGNVDLTFSLNQLKIDEDVVWKSVFKAAICHLTSYSNCSIKIMYFACKDEVWPLIILIFNVTKCNKGVKSQFQRRI